MLLAALPPRPPEPKWNPSNAAKIELGRLLFFDPILSSTKDVSCATCHSPRFGWGDGRVTPIGVGGVGLGPGRKFRTPSTLPSLDRNAPTLLNVGFNGIVSGSDLDPSKAPMFWDSRQLGLEQQVSSPLTARGEMCGENCLEPLALENALRQVQAIGEYRARFQAAFKFSVDEGIDVGRLAQAIAAFERSLVATRTAFDRFERGDPTAMTAEQQRGRQLFQDAGCIQCHGGPMFSDFKLHFIGILDSTPSGRREFRTPSLRNLRYTAPFMHNGSLRSLREVLQFYDQLAEAVSETLDGGDTATELRLDPLLKNLNVNPDEFPALEAFLETLNDSGYDQTIPARVPSGLPVAQ